MRTSSTTSQRVVEERIDRGLTDLEIAKEQLIRHAVDMPPSFDCKYMIEHLELAIDLIKEMYT